MCVCKTCKLIYLVMCTVGAVAASVLYTMSRPHVEATALAEVDVPPKATHIFSRSDIIFTIVYRPNSVYQHHSLGVLLIVYNLIDPETLFQF